jgi:hypothetical protein
MKRDIAEEEAEPGRRTSTLTRRMASTSEDELGDEQRGARRGARGGRGAGGPGGARRTPRRSDRPADTPADPSTSGEPPPPPASDPGPVGDASFEHAPDQVENEGMLPRDENPGRGRGTNKPNRGRGRGHGRR